MHALRNMVVRCVGPEKHGGKMCGYPFSEEDLQEVAELSSVFDGTDDFLEDAFQKDCQRHIPDTNEIEPDQAANAYLYLKDNFDETNLFSV